MLINASTLGPLFQGFSVAFQKGFAGATPRYQDVSMIAPSSTSTTTYGWLGQLPTFREWLGDRVVNSLQAHGYAITNKSFESTVAVPRVAIEDDQYGLFGTLIGDMGQSAAVHPDQLIFTLLSGGTTALCYDGLPFFSAAHPVNMNNAATGTVANMDNGGAGPWWYLFDCSRVIKPLVWQNRIPYEFQPLTNPDDPNVFWRDEFVFGARGRGNAGFGLWQLAYGSNQPLDSAHYNAARAAMRALKGENNLPLGINPDTLVIGPSLESAGRTLINSELVPVGGAGVSNPWKDTAKLIITPWLP